MAMMFQIREHCSRQAEASANDVRDRGRVEQCLKNHVAQKKITATTNKECFAVISRHTTILTAASWVYVQSSRSLTAFILPVILIYFVIFCTKLVLLKTFKALNALLCAVKLLRSSLCLCTLSTH